MKTLKTPLLAAALFGLIGAAGSASAGSESDTMNITVNIDPGCILLVSDFVDTYDGTIDESTAPLSVAVMCNRGTAWELAIDQGQNFGALEPDMRALASGSDYISYELFQDTSLTTLWGSGPNAITGVGNGEYEWLTPTAHFLLHAAPNGTYTDDLIVTLNWADI